MRFPVVLAFRVTKRRIRQALTLHIDDAKTATLINTPHLPPGVRRLLTSVRTTRRRAIEADRTAAAAAQQLIRTFWAAIRG